MTKSSHKIQSLRPCILSIAANLAKGSDLAEACEQAKAYITGFLSGNEDLSGYHF